MIEFQFSRSLFYTSAEVFEQIDNVRRLSRIKKEIRNYRIARDEAGLQIIDVIFGFPYFNMMSRLRYVTHPEKFCELKQIKGSFKEYLCLYTLKQSGLYTELMVYLKIKFPYGPLGFLISKMLMPIISLQLKRELGAIEKQLKQ